jgi:cytochrome c
MKKNVLIIFSSFLFLMSCGDNSSNSSTTTDTTAADKKAEEPAAPAADATATKGMELIAKSDCLTCHKLKEASIGPAYAAIAAKYKSVDQKVAIDSMVSQIHHGGSGKWGTVPMTPHPTISQEDAEAMAHYIMSVQ